MNVPNTKQDKKIIVIIDLYTYFVTAFVKTKDKILVTLIKKTPKMKNCVREQLSLSLNKTAIESQSTKHRHTTQT